MNSHLSEEQVSQWIAGERIAGERSREAEHHLRDCPECAAQIASTQKSLLLFRDSGYQCAEYWQKQPQKPASRSPVRWAVAVVAVALLAAVILHRLQVRKLSRYRRYF